MNNTIITPCGKKDCYCHNTEYVGHCKANNKPRLLECEDYEPDATERMYEILDCITAEVKK